MSGQNRYIGSTNWDAYTIPTMFDSIDPDDNKLGWDQVSAWAQICGSLNGAADWFTAMLTELDDVWNTQKSPAAAAFAAKVQALVDSMRASSTVAEQNRLAVDHIKDTLEKTKARLKPIKDDWHEASTDMIPQWLDWFGDDEGDYTIQAREIMAEAENKIMNGRTLEMPPAFTDEGAREPGGSHDRNGSGGDRSGVGGGFSGSGQSSARSGGLGADFEARPPAPRDGFSPEMPDGREWVPPSQRPDDGGVGVGGGVGAGGGGGIGGGAGRDGVTLSGLTPTLDAHPGGGGSGPGLGGAPGLGGPSGLGGSGGYPSGGGSPLMGGMGGMGPSAGGAGRGGTGAGAGRGTGGVIGGAPGTAGGRGAGAGGRGAGGGTGTGRGGPGGPGGMMPPGAAGRGKRSDDEHDDFDPDNPWEVDQGVAPVIGPDNRRHRHDPGPGVIGSNW